MTIKFSKTPEYSSGQHIRFSGTGPGMRVSGGGPVGPVTSGLAYHWDAANPASYSGGSTWTDLVGGTVATIHNGATGAGGAISFNGVNQYAATSPIAMDLSGGFTMEALVRMNNVSNGAAGVFFSYKHYPGASPSEGILNLLKQPAGDVTFEVDYAQGTTGATDSLSGVWYLFTATFDGSTATIYRNGTVYSTASAACNDGVVNYPLYIGAWDDVYGFYHNGDISVVRLYDRGLTVPEVQQNYLATADRF